MKLRYLIFLVIPTYILGQGFADMGRQVEGFEQPEKGKKFEFPIDHGPHPTFRLEWWYLTANLKDKDGNPYGLQWTLFRTAIAPKEKLGWASPQIWFGHAAVTTSDEHYIEERFARGGIGLAGVASSPFNAWIDEWYMRGNTFNELKLKAAGTDFSYQMDLKTDKPLIFHGQNGYSIKSLQGHSSYYYSQPFFSIEGTLNFLDKKVFVTGKAWLDREWSSQPLAKNQSGWDWFSLSLETGEKVMLFSLRQTDGQEFKSGTWIFPDGKSSHILNTDFELTPIKKSNVGGKEIPTTWRLNYPTKSLDLTVSALNKKAWMDVSIPYWEGPVKVTGSHKGLGYLEMTGY